MDRETELALLDELLGLSAEASAFLDETETLSPLVRYASAERFRDEMERIFRTRPLIAAHCSELPDKGSFLCRDIAGRPVLLTRDGDGTAHAFLNVCRHRGARVVEEVSGRKGAFSCPYHAWTYGNDGALRSIPHEAQGFPKVDKSELGLRRLPCEERHGWVWIVADPAGSIDLDTFIGGLRQDLEWLDPAGYRIAVCDEIDLAANWKLLIEGGIEAYHFHVAHAQTIGPYFIDNLSTYRMFGPHIRSVLPRATLVELKERPRDEWNIREHTNIVFSVFPLNQILVQADHFVWLNLSALANDRTVIRLHTLAPVSSDLDDPEQADYWQRNHDITLTALREDFALGVSIQSGISAGANDALRFGRFEGALDQFNRVTEACLAS